ncbi:MAG: protein-glutamate O-methyltransferase family protein [Spirochaetaceae bacterium]|nr:MAG: protein-glutamate O-methyltransferase family protein [Spirochaetaceae bacterium]
MNRQPEPSPIRTTESNWFAWNTMQQRLPQNIRNIIESNPDLTAADSSRLAELAQQISSGQPIPAPTLPAPDYQEWLEQYLPHAGEHWHDTEWFFGETYAFRLILDACRYWEHARDPFFYVKQAEYDADVVYEPVRVFADMQDRQPAATVESMIRALHAAVWGNRSDLSFSAGAELNRQRGDAELLIVNDDSAAADMLLGAGGPVHIVMDNSGAELAGDLVLALELIRHTAVDLVLHLKIHPTYVSDTTVADFHHFVRSARNSRDARISDYGNALHNAFEQGRIRLAPDAFWCSTHFLEEMPPHIAQTLEGAALVIFKGDLNYRRVVRDTIWPADTPLRSAMGAGPAAPILLLRTMKSDVTAAVPAEVQRRLDQVDPEWRINGHRGVIQLAR